MKIKDLAGNSWIKCKINGVEINDARLAIGSYMGSDCVFICHNSSDSGETYNKFGYKYLSRIFVIDGELDFKISGVTDFKILCPFRRGDTIPVNDSEYGIFKRRIFTNYTPMSEHPFECVDEGDEDKFKRGKKFNACNWAFADIKQDVKKEVEEVKEKKIKRLDLGGETFDAEIIGKLADKIDELIDDRNKEN